MRNESVVFGVILILLTMPFVVVSTEPVDSASYAGYITRPIGTGFEEQAGVDIRTYILVASITSESGETRTSAIQVTLGDSKWCEYILNVSYPTTGGRNFEYYFDFINPSSNKWRHYLPSRPQAFGDSNTFNYNTFQAHYLCKDDKRDMVVNRSQTVKNAMRLWGYVEITRVPTYIEYHFVGHALITDLNGDTVVNIIDVAMVALKMWTEYDSIQDPLTKYDMDMSLNIGIFDLTQVALDFGYHVPP